MAHKFVVNTNDVNEYKYRVLTEGIDTTQYEKNPVVLFQHERFSNENKGSEVIGRCTKLSKENGQLIAEIEFDKDDEYAKKIEGKVARGFIKMCSMYADIISTSTEPAELLPGQLYETVTKSKLVEISIVDIGGNDAALKLSRDGAPVKLQKLNNEKIETMSFKVIALSLGLNADASEDVILKEINAIKLAKDEAGAKLKTFSDEVEKQNATDAEALVDKAIKLNLLPEALKASQLSAFKADFAEQKVTLSKLIEDKETEAGKDGKAKLLKDFVAGKPAGANGSPAESEVTFIKLSKENPNELIRLRREEPEEFKRLFKAQYGTEPTL